MIAVFSNFSSLPFSFLPLQLNLRSSVYVTAIRRRGIGAVFLAIQYCTACCAEWGINCSLLARLWLHSQSTGLHSQLRIM